MKRVVVAATLVIVPLACAPALMLACDVPPSELTADEWVASSFPAPGEQGVPRLVQMHVELDRLVAPDTVRFPAVRIVSGDLQPRLSLHLEPVTRRIIIETWGNLPLEPEATYRLVVEDLVDLDGNAQPEAHEVVFRTGQELGDEPAGPRIEWSHAERVFGPSCAIDGCHTSPEPARGLDFSGSDQVRDTVVGALPRSVPPGWGPAEGSAAALHVFSFPVIDVVGGAGQPAHSYLMYKVLDDPHIMGSPMPPPDAGTGPLSRTELLTLSDWIRAGAPTH